MKRENPTLLPGLQPREVSRHHWTPAEEEQMAILYPVLAAKDVAAILGVTVSSVYYKADNLGLKKSPAFYESRQSTRLNGNDGSGCSTRFTKGLQPWNKGIKGLKYAAAEATQFKPGARPANHRPVGSTRVTVDGYVEIKVAEGQFQWRLLHRENWKAAHGEYPPRGAALIFKDGNKTNCAIDNLELVNRSDLMARNTIHNYPPELKAVIRLAAKVRRALDEHDQ